MSFFPTQITHKHILYFKLYFNNIVSHLQDKTVKHKFFNGHHQFTKIVILILFSCFLQRKKQTQSFAKANDTRYKVQFPAPNPIFLRIAKMRHMVFMRSFPSRKQGNCLFLPFLLIYIKQFIVLCHKNKVYIKTHAYKLSSDFFAIFIVFVVCVACSCIFIFMKKHPSENKQVYS